MQAILTKTLPITAGTHRMRMKATAQAGSITIDWNDALNFEDNHKAAALALATKFGWLGVWIVGFLPDGNGAWVNASETHPEQFAIPNEVVELGPDLTPAQLTALAKDKP